MSNEYFSDNDTFVSNFPLPSPSGTPYHSRSRRTSRYGTPVETRSASPAPFPPNPQENEYITNDKNMSILDPRRLTPTLQANLVAEILSLRRDLDTKNKFIEELETNYLAVHNENEDLTSQLSSSTKEGRTVKRQLQQLENGTTSALEEIVNERDKMKESNADLKERLGATQKKLRDQENDSTRVHDMWAREKEVWGGEKRSLERRVHISESRLKFFLDEIAIQEVAEEEAEVESESEDQMRDSVAGNESDTASARSSPQRRTSTRLARHSRNPSNSSFRSIGRSYRMSVMSGVGSEGHGRLNGMSLADELVFDEEDEDEDLGELELDEDDFFENELRARRALDSRQSMHQDEKAKRILGLSLENQQSSRGVMPVTAETDPFKPLQTTPRCSITLAPRELALILPFTKPQYVDTGVQFSPPPSPTRPDSAASILRPGTAESFVPSKINNWTPFMEIEANQSRKRTSTQSSSFAHLPHVGQSPGVMTSTSSQTLEHPMSPPATPTVLISNIELPPSPQFTHDVVSASTQTEPPEKPEPEPPAQVHSQVIPAPPKRAPPPVPITVPSIAIHAPTSNPSSPKEPILPPGTKSISTQTAGDLLTLMSSTGMQTEPIRVDTRLTKLPPHLWPSAITSKPGTPEHGQGRSTSITVSRKDSHQPVTSVLGNGSFVPLARQDLMTRLEKAAESTIEDRYPGNNDNGPLGRDKDNRISRPFRSSSLFAGFEGPSSDGEDQDVESEDECQPLSFATPMLSSRNMKNGRVFHNPPAPVPEEKETVSPPRPSEDSMSYGRTKSNRNSMERSAKISKPVWSSMSRQPSIRRSAMIQNGAAARVRSRSPSIRSIGPNDMVAKPPFPVPTRSSSRAVAPSRSEGSQSPTPRSNGAVHGRRPYGTKQFQRKDSLRKVRSAAVIQKTGRPRSRSPQLPAIPTESPSPSLPPLPNDLVTDKRFGHQHQLSTNTSRSAGSVAQQANIVDAIAATMVGEWMWKYVRKRKPFGGPETAADLARAGEDAAVTTSNGVRHKRWVWISPYERSVLWSSKQPTSGTALMGKSGRKLIIQSVLDVADNTPIPRNIGSQALFNRSILILTPARALKFTAISQERHCLWLTALSFLAHSNSPVPQLGPVPPGPPAVEELAHRPSHATLRRSHVRDSVRLAKDKANPVLAARHKANVEPMPELNSGSGLEAPEIGSAEPPVVARGPIHSRKRSSTGPSAPPANMAYRSFSHQHIPSVYSSGSSDRYSMAPPSVPSSVYNPHSGITSTRTSEASTSTRQHFFDSMGTVRMEAFIDNALDDPSQKQAVTSRTRMGRRRGNSQWSGSTEPHRGGGIFEDIMHASNDPFRGF